MTAELAGKAKPADVDFDKLEKSNPGKMKTVDLLRRSYDQLRQAVMDTPDSGLDKSVDFFGRKSTVQNVLLTMAMHQEEHLGQSIAYARSNGVVPPWSEKKNGPKGKAEKAKDNAAPPKP